MRKWKEVYAVGGKHTPLSKYRRWRMWMIMSQCQWVKRDKREKKMKEIVINHERYIKIKKLSMISKFQRNQK